MSRERETRKLRLRVSEREIASQLKKAVSFFSSSSYIAADVLGSAVKVLAPYRGGGEVVNLGVYIYIYIYIQ